MRHKALFLLLLITKFFFSQNNLVMISENAEPFQLYLNNIEANKNPESIVKVYGLTESYYTVKIKTAKSEYQIDNQLYLMIKGNSSNKYEFTYALVPYKNTYTLVFLSALPFGKDSVFPNNLKFDKPSASKKDSTRMPIQMLIDDIHYDDTAKCYAALPEDIFNNTKTETSKERFEDVKLRMIKELFPRYCIQTKQLSVLCAHLKFEISRLNLMKEVYRFIDDKQNAAQLKKLLRFEAAQEEWLNFIKSQK